ncbi:poly-beta-1,6-N-acetyl-D-glucosamine biosynthesis protein PgaD [Guyparkeria halopsychrophila]|uniref:poly-beta-1,6-N-acetyl-D-glucosamine biosynthesis protein PgaD n=1 Tax=Guyparkeria halopsychrophila TaxID=3139421 RepID=UPI0037C8AF30
MKRSLPRLPNIIERNDLLTPSERRVGQIVGLVAWAIWIYLFTPTIALIGWLLGAELFERHILKDPMGTLEAVQTYVLVILIAGLIFIGWASYNWIRFRNRERRLAPPPLSSQDLARRFGISLADAESIENHRIVTVHFNEGAEILDIVAQDPVPTGIPRPAGVSSSTAEPSSR